MYRLRSSFGKKRRNAERLPVHACMLLLFSVVILVVFVASNAFPICIYSAQLQEDDFVDETVNEIHKKINEEVGAMMDEIEGVLDGTRLPGKAGEKIDEINEIKDLINQIVESTESEYAADRINALGELVKKLGERVGDEGDQFKPMGDMISGMGEATVGMGDSLKKIEEGRKELREAVNRGWMSPEQYAEEQKARVDEARARYLDAVRDAMEKYEDSKRMGKQHPECPEECTDEYNLWKEAFDKLIPARRDRNDSEKAFRDAVRDYRSARSDFENASLRLDAAKKELADVEEIAKSNAEMKIRKLGGRPAGSIEEFMTPQELRNIEEARVDVKKYSDKKGLQQRFKNAQDRAREAVDRLKSSRAAVDEAKKAEEAAWAAYRKCVQECTKPEDQSLYIPDYDIGPGEPISYALGSLANLDAVRIGNESPKWCHTSAGTPGHVPIDGFSPRDIFEPGTVTPPGETAIRPGDVTPEMLRKLELSLPPSQPMDPSDELEYLQRLATLLTFLMIDPDLKDDERRRVEQILLDTKMEILGLQAGLQDEAGEDPRDTAEPESSAPPEEISVPTITIYVKAQTSVLVGEQDMTLANVGQQVKLFGASVLDPALPADGADKPQTGHDQGPVQGTTDDKGSLALKVPMTALGIDSPGVQPLSDIGGPAFQVTIDTTPQSSVNVKVGGVDPKAAVGSVPDSARSFLVDVNKINGSVFLTFMFPSSMEGPMNKILVSIPGVVNIEINYCRTKEVTLDDPHFNGIGGWGQSYDDQWAIKRVGLTDDPDSAWNKMGTNPHPVIVAVIDSGLDWNHLDFDWRNLWQNPSEIPNNGIDDDNNGYIDDMIGWDFFANNNKPWDHDGHGTIVSGIIAASQNNGIGISGINPHARIMVCKALNNFGNTRASYLAKAIVYAVDNGARVINMSVGGKNLTQIEQEAVAYAVAKGVLIVAASGNEGVNVEGFGLAGLDGVMTVAATGLDDKRSVFSNWGGQVDIAAPGIEVLGLRARLTDTMRDIPGVEYVDGANFVGEDNRYYRGSGTSFAAPIVTGIASLVISKKPEFTGPQVARILKQSARDIDVPGVDQFSGFGLVDASAALDASPEFFIHSSIQRVEVVQGEKGPVVQVFGTADADLFQKAMIAIGAGDDPSSWKDVVEVNKIVKEGLLGSIPAQNFVGAKVWMIRLTTEHRSGVKREFRFRLSVG